jgi:hypothetical protein
MRRSPYGRAARHGPRRCGVSAIAGSIEDRFAAETGLSAKERSASGEDGSRIPLFRLLETPQATDDASQPEPYPHAWDDEAKKEK